MAKNPPAKISYWERWANFTVRFPRSILICVAVLTLFFAFFLGKLNFNTNLKDFHRAESLKLANDIEDMFHEGDTLLLFFEAKKDDSLLSPLLLHQQLRILQALHKKFRITSKSLAKGIDEGLRRNKGKSLLEFEDYTPIAEGILALSGPRTIMDLERVSQNYLSHPEAISFYSKFRIAAGRMGAMGGGGIGDNQWKFTIPYVKAVANEIQLSPDYPETKRQNIMVEIRDLVNRLETPELKVHVLALPLVSYDIDKSAKQNGLWMALLLLLADGFFLWMIFRSSNELLKILCVMVTACIWTFGMAQLLGFKFTFLHTVVLPILLGTGIDDSVVFGRRFREELKNKLNNDQATPQEIHFALGATYRGVGKSIFLTTFTTFAAFLIAALNTTAPAVRSFFFLVAISMVIVFVLTILLEGSFRSYIYPRLPSKRLNSRDKPTQSGAALWFEKCIGAPAVLALKINQGKKKFIILGTAFIFVSGAFLITRLQTSFEPDIFMRKGTPIHRAFQVQEEYFGRHIPGYILLKGDVTNPDILNKLSEFQKSMVRYPLMERVLGKPNATSILDLMNRAKLSLKRNGDVKSIFDQLSSNKNTYDFVLNTPYQEKASHLLYKNGDGYRGLNVKFYVNKADAKAIGDFTHQMKTDLEKLGIYSKKGLKVGIGGGVFSYYLEQNYFFSAFLKSFLISLFVNLIFLILIWKSWRYGLIGIIPLILAVVATVGIMSLFQVKLNVLNLCIGAIVIGLGIDYPIHLIERYREEILKQKSDPGRYGENTPIRQTIESMGPPLFGSSLTTIVGFCAALVFAMPITQSFGLFTGVAILLTYLGSLWLMPVFLKIGSKENRTPPSGEPIRQISS